MPRFALCVAAFFPLFSRVNAAAWAARSRPPPASATGRYPALDWSHPGIEVLREEPPVLLVHGLLSQEECDVLLAAGEAGEASGLTTVGYRDAVLLDQRRLLLLAPLLAAAPVPSVLRLLESGQGVTEKAVALAVLGPLAVAGLGALILARLVVLGMSKATADKVFTGSKWSTATLAPDTAAHGVVDQAKRRAAALCCTTTAHLEVPTVTRYQVGELQRVHNDARPRGDPDEYAAFVRNGGQRMVQVLTYLNTVDEDAGGATRFWDRRLQGLGVQPRKGAALVFFPAFADGEMDPRMPHSGEAVTKGEKWTLNTWVQEFPTVAPQADDEDRDAV